MQLGRRPDVPPVRLGREAGWSAASAAVLGIPDGFTAYVIDVTKLRKLRSPRYKAAAPRPATLRNGYDVSTW